MGKVDQVMRQMFLAGHVNVELLRSSNICLFGDLLVDQYSPLPKKHHQSFSNIKFPSTK